MNKYLTPLLFFLMSQLISGCGSGAQAQVSETTESLTIDFVSQSGAQTDLFNQQTEVINTYDEYREFWLSAPSIDDLPDFDENNETLIIILSPFSSCGFEPLILDVEKREDQILVTVGRLFNEAPETCNPSPGPLYGYSWVTISKTPDLIGVVFDI